MSTLLSVQHIPRRSISIGVLAILLIVAVGLLIIPYSNGLSRAFTLASTHQPERFSQLYFVTTKQTPLPTSAPAGVAKVFTFHIENHESQTTPYDYLVTLQIGTTVTTILSGTTILKDGMSTDIPVTYAMPIPAATGQISVQLVHRVENINFRSQS